MKIVLLSCLFGLLTLEAIFGGFKRSDIVNNDARETVSVEFLEAERGDRIIVGIGTDCDGYTVEWVASEELWKITKWRRAVFNL
jgi:hypothetical protein